MKHLDGRVINIGRTGTTQPDEVEVIEGEGVSSSFPSYDARRPADPDRCHHSTMSRRETCILNIA